MGLATCRDGLGRRRLAREDVVASLVVFLQALRNPYTCNSGLARRPADGEEVDDVLAEADQALGRSKRKSHESRTLPRVVPAAESRGHGR